MRKTMKTERLHVTEDAYVTASEKFVAKRGHQAMRHLIKDKLQQGDDMRPFYIANLDDIVNKHKHWVKLMPRVKPFYAVKCNNTEPVVKTIAALGAGFDCASSAEFQQVLKYGVETDRIIYAQTCKDPEEIKHASERGVDLMTFDNEDELVKIKHLYPHARLVLRILPQVQKAVLKMGKKFGCAIKNCKGLLLKAKELELNVVGISFHVGSSCLDAFAYEHTISLCRGIFDMAKTIGYNFNLLDIGGGFPGFETEEKLSLSEIAKAINNSLEKYFPEGENVKVIAEPGRYYVQSAFTLAVRVIARRVERPDSYHDDPSDRDDAQKTFMYYLNDGLHGSFYVHIVFEKHAPDFYLLENKDSMPVFQSSLWGPTCNPFDCITQEIELPELDIGDWLYVPNMGAYTTVLLSSFNGIPTPKIHWIA
ncbi:ornithine decarboxylase [Lingula anatina]|uniref:ornithine decarboxylase n=1 Tax=Lingula anatina TaxID=7574 RepID=A0A1S3HD79_LINAN|nr:ornithine decarboxylase [Lingula anatina]|eukprot:XP_013383988.1 ornithine decarboxylase [Lingula anatina]